MIQSLDPPCASSSVEHHLAMVSVIIPVYNDPERLRICLAALERQTYPSGLYEIIVVDNGSDEPVVPIAAQFPHARVVHESRPGSYAARNRGIVCACGSVLAFTDADCIPAGDWLGRGVESLLGMPSAGVVGGKIEVLPRDPAKPTIAEVYDMIMSLRQEVFVTKARFAATANLVTLRTLFDDVGFFPEDMMSTGDREWGRRASDHGYQMFYAEHVCVYHPARDSMKQLVSKTRRLTGGLYDGSRMETRTLRGSAVFLVKQVLSPIWSTQYAIPRAEGIKHKLGVVLMIFLLQYVQYMELIRLSVGRPPRRK